MSRSSARQRLVVVPGDDMLTALVRARERLGPPEFSQARPGQILEEDAVVVDDQLLPYCHEVVKQAVHLFLFPALPAGWSITCCHQDALPLSFSPSSSASTAASASASAAVIRYQVILEDFSSPVSTHAASGRLAKVILKIVDDRILCITAGQGQGHEAPTLKLKKGGGDLSVEACKDVITIFPKLLPMLLLYLNTECNNCTVFQTKNRKETKNWLETYCKATHEESLLF
jgi:hypothetical protein